LQANKWKKRGLGFTPLAYNHQIGKYAFSVQVAIYAADATIAITHGGIEIGQGVNTKVSQVVAKEFGLPDLSLITVKTSNSFVANNNNWTGGSQASDNCVWVRTHSREAS
jgi:xanthine dehydrogenase/oxidase